MFGKRASEGTQRRLAAPASAGNVPMKPNEAPGTSGTRADLSPMTAAMRLRIMSSRVIANELSFG